MLDMGDWGLWVDHCCCVAARVLPGVSHASLCTYLLVNTVGVQSVSASYDEYTALVKCEKFKVTRENTGALAYCWSSCEDRCGVEYQVNSSQL